MMPPDSETPITVTLPLRDWWTIVALLEAAPWRDVAHILSSAANQVIPQVNAAVEAAQAKAATNKLAEVGKADSPVLN